MNKVHNPTRTAKANAILATALELVLDGGIEAFTLRRLAEARGASLGAMYRHFSSKAAVLVAIQTQLLDALGRDLASARATGRQRAKSKRRPRDVVELAGLWAMVEYYVALPVSDPGRYRLIASLVGDPRRLLDDQHAHAVIEAATRLFAQVAEALNDANDAGAFATDLDVAEADVSQRAVIFWAALHGVVQLEKLARVSDALDPSSLARQLVETLFLGWGAKPTRSQSAARVIFG